MAAVLAAIEVFPYCTRETVIRSTPLCSRDRPLSLTTRPPSMNPPRLPISFLRMKLATLLAYRGAIDVRCRSFLEADRVDIFDVYGRLLVPESLCCLSTGNK